MAFALGVHGMNKRVRSINASGEEEYEQVDTWADLRLIEEKQALKKQALQQQTSEAGSTQAETISDDKVADDSQTKQKKAVSYVN